MRRDKPADSFGNVARQDFMSKMLVPLKEFNLVITRDQLVPERIEYNIICYRQGLPWRF